MQAVGSAYVIPINSGCFAWSSGDTNENVHILNSEQMEPKWMCRGLYEVTLQDSIVVFGLFN